MHQLQEETRAWTATLTPLDLPDSHLVQMAQRDPAAFVHLYDRYLEAIYRFCARRLPISAAEDATSITFLNALKAINRFDPNRAGFKPWLFSIANNAVIDQTRGRRHAPIDEFDLEEELVSLDDHVVAIDDHQRLILAVEQLPIDQQEVIHLRLASLTGPEIAEAMGRSREAVRGLQHRAIKRLRTLMNPSDFASAAKGEEDV